MDEWGKTIEPHARFRLSQHIVKKFDDPVQALEHKIPIENIANSMIDGSEQTSMGAS